MKRAAVVSVALVVGLIGTASGAAALHGADFSVAVSCDGNTIQTAGSVNHYNPDVPFGDGMSVTQKAQTTQTSTSRVFFRGPSGNDTVTKSVSNNTTATWDGIAAGVYKVMVYRSTASNCNGVLPGNGNYNWVATVNVGLW
ncbi:hypothetical protein [Cellulomonas sp. Y8]|uniref:hypothetical protein n=1 Tax=Cellulomonas sp. Y8 TaxID=2591145 RepID=UPI003D7528A7